MAGGAEQGPDEPNPSEEPVRPRPSGKLRAWRKPAGELLIVFVGVVLGLLATEWVSERKSASDVADARAALKRELSVNLDAVRFRQQISPCVRRRVEDLRQWIARQRAGDRSALPAEIGRPGSRLPATSVWEVVKTGQVAAKMPLEDRLRFAAIYDSLESSEGLQLSERDIWFGIGDFAGLSGLSAAELARLQGLVARAAAFDEAVSSNAARMMARFQELGIEAGSEEPAGLSARRALCQPFLGAAVRG